MPSESNISLVRIRFVFGQVTHSRIPVGLESEMTPLHDILLVSQILMDPSSPPDATRVPSNVMDIASMPWGWPVRIPCMHHCLWLTGVFRRSGENVVALKYGYLFSVNCWNGMLQMIIRQSNDPDTNRVLLPETAIAVTGRWWSRKVFTNKPSEKSGDWSRGNQSYTWISLE